MCPNSMVFLCFLFLVETLKLALNRQCVELLNFCFAKTVFINQFLMYKNVINYRVLLFLSKTANLILSH